MKNPIDMKLAPQQGFRADVLTLSSIAMNVHTRVNGLDITLTVCIALVAIDWPRKGQQIFSKALWSV
jgi:hypothetical protein